MNERLLNNKRVYKILCVKTSYNQLVTAMIMMLQEKYEARMQVIAQDLEQAQSTADQLKYMLDEREAYLHGELQNKQMNNQMISKSERGEGERERENHSWIF